MTKDELECAFEGIGRQVGALVHCIVQAEISAKLQQIEQLQLLLSGQRCQPSDSLTAERETPTS